MRTTRLLQILALSLVPLSAGAATLQSGGAVQQSPAGDDRQSAGGGQPSQAAGEQAAAPPGGGQATPPTSGQATPPPGQPGSGQDTAPQPSTAAADAKERWVGEVEFGFVGSSVDGDRGRFERYRDLRNGPFADALRLNREYNGTLFSIEGEHIGRRDARYIGNMTRPGRFTANFMWDQIPMRLSEQTRSLFSGIGTGVLEIDDATQALGQANPGALTDVFNGSSVPFATKTRRHIADGMVEYVANEEWTVRANFRQTNRSGTIPFGGAFGHSSVIELPAPTEHMLSDFDGTAEWVRNPVMLRAGYTGSWFHNDVTSLIWDNPFRATDIATASSRGRLTLSPSNSLIGVNGTGSVKLPRRSRLTVHGSIGMLQDAGDPLVPQTVNTATSPAPIDRATADAEARIGSINVHFVSRPLPYLDVNVRYRSYDFDNQTPTFTLTQRVAYDNAPGAVAPPIHAEQFSLLRDTLDAEVKYVFAGRTSAGVGFLLSSEDRTHRHYETIDENAVRFLFDSVQSQWFTLRSEFEHSSRRGEGLDLEVLTAVTEQPGMRHYDIASRDRNRFTLIGTVTPVPFLIGSASLAVGKDDYIESEFGLRDNTHQVFSLGADVIATDRVDFGVSYSYEDYDALNRSRQANPGVQFLDPSRNWAADTSDKTHSVIVSANVAQIAEKVDLRLSYDFNRGRATYNYITGPVSDRTLPEEVVVPTTLPPPTQLPPTFSELQRGTIDAVYSLSRRLGLGVSYWYERFRVRDFTLDIDANPELVRGQALLIGYLYEPYTANTGWVRLIYRF
jgi:MtrB/PioB family decaheme-associated outer membrane protein